MMDWDDYPVILGFGSTHDMRDADEGEPRMWQFKSVSKAAALAYHKRSAPKPRPVGFHARKP
jgi:hypothetical protein